jgi:hypothetical protein
MKTEKEAEGRELLARQLTSEKSRTGYSGTRATGRIPLEKWLRQSEHPLHFLPEGVKQNGALYREFLQTKVFPWTRRTYGQRHWIFQQDGAPSHKAEETQNLIRDNVPEFIEVDISPQRNNGEWPPNSPDLNVLDYTIWSILKAEACAKPHQSIESLKKSLVAAWKKIPQEVIDRAVDAFPKKLQKCIDAGGGHFENQ